jgi:hypothetical protein
MISIFFCRARIKASEVIVSTTSSGMVGIDGLRVADEMLALIDVTVVDKLGREGVGGLLDLPSLEKTFKMTLRSLGIVFVR